MFKVTINHLNDKIFNKQFANDSNLINLDEIYPLKADFDEKITEINEKYNSETEYILIVNSTFFTSVRDFVFGLIPREIELLVTNSNLNIEKIYINNPPDRVIQAFNDHSEFSIKDIPREGFKLDNQLLLKLKENLDNEIKGQELVKKRILVNLTKYLYSDDKRPIVLAFIGPQGVGKTELAKVISNTLFEDGILFREQMSMLTNNASQDYLFGSDTSSKSFSKALLQRKSDVLLLDEFNLVNPYFYGAFYQMFDEGEFVDGYYTVKLNKAIIICTANFMSKDEMVQNIGAPLYSRFTDICVFDELSREDYLEIAKQKITEKIENIRPEYQKQINIDKIIERIKNIGTFQDSRNLDHVIDQLISLQILNKNGIIKN